MTLDGGVRTLDDSGVRERIARSTGETLFVNAGAGSGKTTALVERVASLVITDGVPMAAVAAVTFTEKAGAELRDRLREKFEQIRRAGGDAAALADTALNDLDQAAIGTLHAFAQRILTEHPVEAGIPPLIEVLDEVGSSVAFDERWNGLQTDLLDDETIARPLLMAMAAGMKPAHLRSLALALGRDWDLIGERILHRPRPELVLPSFEGLLRRARRLLEERGLCTVPGDRLLQRLDVLGALVDGFGRAADEQSRLAVVRGIGSLSFGKIGAKGNWRGRPIQEIRDEAAEVCAEAKDIADGVLDQSLRILVHWVARRVLDAAEARRVEGALEFHDLLVLARNVLRTDPDVRATLHDTYRRLLLDEFQDTDPIQIELAARICGDGHAEDWHDITIPPGRLFVVGDAKQSIYRFRRASIATYLQAQGRIGRPLELTTNFRTVGPILDWVNAVFGTLITEVPDAQPAYEPLGGHRADTGEGTAVTVLGADAHDDKPNASALREREAADVASVIRQALDEGWTVFDRKTRVWRPARRDDIAVLVPARTSLPFLEEALDAAGVSYRAEASSLVYHAEEVRSLLAAARAVADSSDGLSLVTALRSPLFGCGDDDLWRWKQAGGYFGLRSEVEGPLADGPVGSSLAYLRKLSYEARWMTPSELLGRLVADRRMYEVAATGPRARDSWRRLRFVVDQARAWSEVSHGGLRGYLAWAAHQGQEVSRVAESVLPETDADAVRVMTVHAAKGLEFPIVILSGMTSQANNPSGVRLLWPADGGYEVKLTKTIQTGDFEAAQPVDEQMDQLERLRLLYVGATRARDHLVVSLHRAAGSSRRTAAKSIADAGGGVVAGATVFDGFEFSPAAVPSDAAAPPPDLDTWLAGIEASRTNTRRQPAITASGLEGTEPAIALNPDPAAGAAKGPRDLELPPWSKGRYGSAIGRAVHAVLQSVDLGTGAGLAEAVAAQAVAEGVIGHEHTVRALVQAALDSDVMARAAGLEHWRETYLGTVQDDGKILEGYADLIYRDPDGALVIVDYKTDAVPAGAIQSRVEYYRPQMDAYRQALSAATGAEVSATLLFLNPSTSVAVEV
ncbi:MAG TPA: UvrD-helicase domain-containing protein [Pseudonocardia sp.]|nr:UvrD-helicase domain-containing protein [Pseudonocardia sp.]